MRVLLVFLRRLLLPLAVFAGFSAACIAIYHHLEGLNWLDALFWMIHPHAIDYQRVHPSTKIFALFVYLGVLAFQIWIAERVLVTIFRRQGGEAWRNMVNDISIDKLQNHFIICGYGQVGRTVVDQLKLLNIPFVLVETNESQCRELLKEKILVIQGDAARQEILQRAGIDHAQGVCIVIDNDAHNLLITVTAKALNPKIRIITRAGHASYAQAMRNSGADEVIIPEYEGGLMTGRMIAKYYPSTQGNLR
jgi:voltage-gated potassium channel